MKYESNKAEVLGMLRSKRASILDIIGTFIMSQAVYNIYKWNAQEQALIDTGNLVNSITYNTYLDHVDVGTPVEYAEIHEVGAGVKKRPFLRPAVDRNLNVIRKIAEDAMK